MKVSRVSLLCKGHFPRAEMALTTRRRAREMTRGRSGEKEMNDEEEEEARRRKTGRQGERRDDKEKDEEKK